VHNPQVSVCIPVTRSEPALKQCVEGVLAQSFQDFEILLGLGIRRDKLDELPELALADARVRIVEMSTKKTQAAILNDCIAQSRGEYIKFVSPGDVLRPRCLEKFVQAFRVCRTLTLASCAFDLKTPNDESAGTWKNGHLSEVISGTIVAKKHLLELTDFVGSFSATFFRRDYGLSGIDERYFNLGEFDFWVRLAAYGDYLFLNEPLCAVSLLKDSSVEKLNRESLLAFHDFFLLRDNFSSFALSENIDPMQFVESIRAASDQEFRKKLWSIGIPSEDCKRAALLQSQQPRDATELGHIFESYAGLSYELLVAYASLRNDVFYTRDLLAEQTTKAEAAASREALLRSELMATRDESARMNQLSAGELAGLTKKYELLSIQYHQAMSSVSWRITQPFRRFNRPLKRLWRALSRLLSVRKYANR
jgi:glycosyltransferase involved in cell wall biosynthesis